MALTKHSKISFVKSGIRIVGYLWLGLSGSHHNPLLIMAAVLLAVAEGLGIWEEIGTTY